MPDGGAAWNNFTGGMAKRAPPWTAAEAVSLPLLPTCTTIECMISWYRSLHASMLERSQMLLRTLLEAPANALESRWERYSESSEKLMVSKGVARGRGYEK